MLARRLHSKWALRERMADKRTVSVLGNRVRTTTPDLRLRGSRHSAFPVDPFDGVCTRLVCTGRVCSGLRGDTRLTGCLIVKLEGYEK